MRHESTDTAMRSYVGRNAQTTAQVLWDAHKRLAPNTDRKCEAATSEPVAATVDAANYLAKSGRQDLNLRPLDPQSSALARLRHAPK